MLINNTEVNDMLSDLQLTLNSLNYTKNEIKSILPIIIKETDASTRREFYSMINQGSILKKN